MLQRLLPWLFAALAGPACLFLALAVPPGEVPDEAAHAVRADSLWHGEVLGHRTRVTDATIEAGVDANRSLLAVTATSPPGPIAQKRLTAEGWAGLAAVAWDGAAGFVPAPNVAVYLPVLYLPAALGLGAARAAGLSPLRSLLAARLANATVFLALGSLALALARAGQVVIFVCLTLPMTLWLAGSVSPDGLLIAVSTLAAAALTRMTAAARWPVVLAGGAIALLGATKPCYLPLALAMLAPLRAGQLRGRALGRHALLVAAVALPGLVWSAIAAITVAVPFARPPYLPGPFWPGDPTRVFASTDVGAQMRVLFHRPWRLLTLPLAALRASGRNVAVAAIGVLGQLDLVLPLLLYQAWFAALLAATGADLSGGRWRSAAVSPLGGLVIAVALVASGLAIYLLEYLSWTHVGSATIEGVQGRYLLPLLPFAGVALSAVRLADAPRLSAALAALPILVAAISAAVTADCVLRVYYLR